METITIEGAEALKAKINAETNPDSDLGRAVRLVEATMTRDEAEDAMEALERLFGEACRMGPVHEAMECADTLAQNIAKALYPQPGLDKTE